MTGMTLKAIAQACGGTIHGYTGTEETVKGVELDSRKLQEGYLFVATRGERVDGHSFIPQAFEKGCLGVVCEELPENMAGACILVENSIKALQEIAAFYREQLAIKVVGITGSVGKTSTKEIIASTLAAKYNVLKTEGNFNNLIGLPLTILKIRDEHQVAVLEMGISEFGEMHELSRMAKPDICVITNIGQCHLEFLGDRNGVLKAKTEMFDFMKSDGIVCLNGDDDKLITIKEVYGNAPIFFGKGENCDIQAVDVENYGLEGASAWVVEKNTEDMCAIDGNPVEKTDGKWQVRVHVPGEHMILNAMAAVAVGRALGLNSEEIKQGISAADTIGGRSHIIRSEKLTIIDDCYNANPVSMKAAVELLDTAATRKVAILGDMFELGADEKKLHHEVGSFITHKNIDVVICIGDLAEEIYLGANVGSAKCYHFKTKTDMMAQADRLLRQNDTILLKASHGMGFSELVDFCSFHTFL